MYINLSGADNSPGNSCQSLEQHANDLHDAFAQAISSDTHRKFSEVIVGYIVGQQKAPRLHYTLCPKTYRPPTPGGYFVKSLNQL